MLALQYIILFSSCGAKETLNIITNVDFPEKKNWVFYYYQCLPKNDIQQKQIETVLKLYQTLDYENLNPYLDFLLNYENIQKGVITKVFI